MRHFSSLIALLCLFSLCSIAKAQNRIADPGFEQASNDSGWQRYESGYETDTAVRHGGQQSIRCANATDAEKRGASYPLEVNQTTPAPLLVTGWSKAQEVSGGPNGDYSIYVDLRYQDGTPLWGQIAPFGTGTHDWQHRQVLIVPSKPLKSATVYALFRGHAGTVWFDDFASRQLSGDGIFDSQPIAPPKLPGGAASGWFARDVAVGSPVLPLSPNGSPTLGLHWENGSGGVGQEERIVTDTTGKPRAITLYYVERFEAPGALWWNDVRQSIPVGTSSERSNLTRINNVGANGTLSLYPFGCVSGKGKARMLGVPPGLGPRIVRIAYHAGAKLFYVAFDLALTGDNVTNSDGKGHGRAKVAVARADVDPAWGFRAAAAAYYRLFPTAFMRRAKAEGIWMPFTDPATIPNVQDFGIAYHEGDNNIAGDDNLGVASFRYTEPMTWWMPMPPEVPRTYEAALGILHQHLNGPNEENRRWAQAIINSGSEDENGKFNVEFQNAPWANGAVWNLNPNPRLPHPADDWTKGRLAYDSKDADARYNATSKGTLDGEYLDSLEGWADTLDFRPETLRFAQTPPTFTSDDFRPVVPTWFSVYDLSAFMSDDLHRRGKLLMANSTPWRFHAFLPILDVAGTETNWLLNGEWHPDSDAVFNLRRTLCYHKPYLLLQNTNFDRFGTEQVEKYFMRSMFYGVFPSMFSVDAANHPYWQEKGWYERDRALFKKYIPVIQRLSAAGWEPVTNARSDHPAVYLERFGKEYLTVLNDSNKAVRATITLDFKAWPKGAMLRVTDAMTGAKVADVTAGVPRFVLALAPEQGAALRLEMR